MKATNLPPGGEVGRGGSLTPLKTPVNIEVFSTSLGRYGLNLPLWGYIEGGRKGRFGI